MIVACNWLHDIGTSLSEVQGRPRRVCHHHCRCDLTSWRSSPSFVVAVVHRSSFVVRRLSIVDRRSSMVVRRRRHAVRKLSAFFVLFNNSCPGLLVNMRPG